jgi:hypothetical protein
VRLGEWKLLDLDWTNGFWQVESTSRFANEDGPAQALEGNDAVPPDGDCEDKCPRRRSYIVCLEQSVV